MRMKTSPLHIALIISVLLGLAGLYLTMDSYNTKMSLLAAENQLEFLRCLPQLAGNPAEPVKLPAYQSNIILEQDKRLKGILYSSYYKSVFSIRQTAVTIKKAGFSPITLETLLDARERR
jgi:Tfp pilus assembly protein PilV